LVSAESAGQAQRTRRGSAGTLSTGMLRIHAEPCHTGALCAWILRFMVLLFNSKALSKTLEFDRIESGSPPPRMP